MTDEQIIKALEAFNGYTIIDLAIKLINRQKAEIERLQGILDERCDVCSAVSTAIKEVWERAKDYIPNIEGGTTMKCVERAINQAAKEMVGE